MRRVSAPATINSPTVSSTAVDLSRLPAPTVVEQLSYETIRAEALAELAARLPGFDALVESDPAIKVLEVFAYREVLIRQSFNDRARAVMLAYAKGADLDQLAALVGVARLVIAPANPQTNAPAVMEGDEALRARVVLAPESFSVAGPELAYIFHARTADADVIDASATSPEPGEVVVTVLSRAGTGSASSELVDTVEAVVASRPVRPLTDHVTVQSAAIRHFSVRARLVLYQGPDSGLVIETARAKVEAYVRVDHRLGRDITLSGLYAALQVEGVQDVQLLEPLASILIAPTAAAWCDDIHLTFAGHGE